MGGKELQEGEKVCIMIIIIKSMVAKGEQVFDIPWKVAKELQEGEKVCTMIIIIKNMVAKSEKV